MYLLDVRKGLLVNEKKEKNTEVIIHKMLPFLPKLAKGFASCLCPRAPKQNWPFLMAV